MDQNDGPPFHQRQPLFVFDLFQRPEAFFPSPAGVPAIIPIEQPAVLRENVLPDPPATEKWMSDQSCRSPRVLLAVR